MSCLVVDDHPLVCSSIRSILKECSCIKEVITSNSFSEGLDIIKNKHISLLLLDIHLSDGDGFDFLKRARTHGYLGKVIFISAENQDIYKQMAFRAGADAYVSKNEGNDVFLNTIKLVNKGYAFFKYDYVTNIAKDVPELSNRENAVLRFLLKGLSNRKISELLSISEKTVSTYKSRILTKYNVKNLLELSQVIRQEK